MSIYALELSNLQGDFELVLSQFMDIVPGLQLYEFYVSNILELFVWCPITNEEDGLTLLYFDEHGNKKCHIYLREDVLRSQFLCWRYSVMLHELAHSLHFFSDSVKHGKQIPEGDYHGEVFQQVLKEAVNNNKRLIKFALLEQSPNPRCLLQGNCPWCQ